MPWEVIVLPLAERDIAQLPQRDRDAVLRALARVGEDPHLTDLKKLRGSERQ